VVGKGDEGSKPVVRGATSKSETQAAKNGTQDLMKTEVIPETDVLVSIYYMITDSAHILTSAEAELSEDHDTCFSVSYSTNGVVDTLIYTTRIDTLTLK